MLLNVMMGFVSVFVFGGFEVVLIVLGFDEELYWLVELAGKSNGVTL